MNDKILLEIYDKYYGAVKSITNKTFKLVEPYYHRGRNNGKLYLDGVIELDNIYTVDIKKDYIVCRTLSPNDWSNVFHLLIICLDTCIRTEEKTTNADYLIKLEEKLIIEEKADEERRELQRLKLKYPMDS